MQIYTKDVEHAGKNLHQRKINFKMLNMYEKMFLHYEKMYMVYGNK